eukprot:g45457.t1
MYTTVLPPLLGLSWDRTYPQDGDGGTGTLSVRVMGVLVSPGGEFQSGGQHGETVPEQQPAWGYSPGQRPAWRSSPGAVASVGSKSQIPSLILSFHILKNYNLMRQWWKIR